MDHIVDLYYRERFGKVLIQDQTWEKGLEEFEASMMDLEPIEPKKDHSSTSQTTA